MIETQAHFDQAMALFDTANAEDPNQQDGQPKELLYSQRMSDMLARFAPDASEAAQLAVRAQHIRRWTVPRNSYPMTKEGYHAWRTGLYKFHADTAGDLMRQAGYDEAMIERVKKAVGKRGIKVNAESQLLEDIANLVFIEHYMLDFAQSKPEYDEAKWIDIIRRTWSKMSKDAQAFALAGKIKLPEPLIPLITKAISD
ncbi:conserved hypothetical protein [Thiobacillus denitrificans ATCC 25259]|uniref:Glutamyl-tRNA synthetase n=1 Tax=Thiobacillus denitrificans (strain ATCC 25259 / T1) TaxID=292415 RepID=Q3SGF5_THIDA|nr:DUF4202 domain-containing protein [Thiobacillus denitrificans]AAZ98295.1 conserved hypothetical protein [Thiobacillus denitrificans ATCC 25259]